MSDKTMELGLQPLDALMEELNLTNHDLVAASDQGLTHKQVAKGRKGRRLTRNIQEKILTALKRATDRELTAADLFTYR